MSTNPTQIYEDMAEEAWLRNRINEVKEVLFGNLLDENFKRYEIEIARRLLLAIILVTVLMGALVTPLDTFVAKRDEMAATGVFWWRIESVGLALCLATALIYVKASYAVRPLIFLFTSMVAIHAGFRMAAFGGMERPWIYAAMLFPVLSIPMHVDFRLRVLYAIWLPALYLGAFAWAREEVLDTIGLVALGQNTLWSVGLCVTLGASMRHFMWLAYQKRRNLKKRTTELEESNVALERIVVEQTSEMRALIAKRDQELDELRARIAQDLHDDLANFFAAMKLDLHLLRLDTDPDNELYGGIVRLQQAVTSVIQTVRGVIDELHPASLLQHGMKLAIQRAVNSVDQYEDISCGYMFEGDSSQYPQDLQLALYRVTNEALTNALSHSLATDISLDVHAGVDHCVITVRDNGSGFDTEDGHGGHGIRGMQERISRFGGNIEFESDRSGTQVTITAPIQVAPEISE